MSKYVKTPLRYFPEGQMILANDDALLVADIRGFGYLTNHAGGEGNAMAAMDEIGQRLADCWNACQGINPKAVPLLVESLKLMYEHEGEREVNEIGMESDSDALELAKMKAKKALELAAPKEGNDG